MGLFSGAVRAGVKGARRTKRKAEQAVRKAVTPSARELDIEALTEGTPLIEGGGRRAGPPSEQRGDEIPLMRGQVGAGNLRKTAEEGGRRQGVADTNIRDLKILGGAAAGTGVYQGIKMLLGSDSAASKDFKETFRAARNADEQHFTWRGKKYHTKTVEEVAGLKKRMRRPKPKPTPPAKKAMGGMVGKKSRNGDTDYRKTGMFYVGGTSARVTPINKGKK
mgnify:FL=1|jgi:hypothetical protein|tara:strand:+ start:261 stop:923 length:663 start_codon:yes stop_codon:yes gene_type:complete